MKITEYEISEDGIVTEIETGKEVPVKRDSNKTELYVNVDSPSGKTRRISITRLVAFAFVPNPNNYSNVDHKDEDLLNNNADNLEWVESDFDRKYPDKIPVKCIETGIIYDNIHTAVKAVWGYAPSILMAASGICETAAGYHWEFIKGED